MTNVEALKALYVALGGDADDVANVSTIVGVLNAIAAKYDGEDDATLNPEAISNIAEIAGSLTPTLIEKNITANGEYAASADEADGYSSVNVTVSPTLKNESVTPTTAEQTITAGEGYDGLGTVTVAAVTSAIDANIVAGNIKDGVTILGVTGNYTG